MIKPFRLHAQTCGHWKQAPLAPHLASFAALLAQQRYCRVTGWNKLRLVAALSQWMVQTKLPLKRPQRTTRGEVPWLALATLRLSQRRQMHAGAFTPTPASMDVIQPPTPVPLTPIDVMGASIRTISADRNAASCRAVSGNI